MPVVCGGGGGQGVCGMVHVSVCELGLSGKERREAVKRLLVSAQRAWEATTLKEQSRRLSDWKSTKPRKTAPNEQGGCV